METGNDGFNREASRVKDQVQRDQQTDEALLQLVDEHGGEIIGAKQGQDIRPMLETELGEPANGVLNAIHRGIHSKELGATFGPKLTPDETRTRITRVYKTNLNQDHPKAA